MQDAHIRQQGCTHTQQGQFNELPRLLRRVRPYAQPRVLERCGRTPAFPAGSHRVRARWSDETRPRDGASRLYKYYGSHFTSSAMMQWRWNLFDRNVAYLGPSNLAGSVDRCVFKSSHFVPPALVQYESLEVGVPRNAIKRLWECTHLQLGFSVRLYMRLPLRDRPAIFYIGSRDSQAFRTRSAGPGESLRDRPRPGDLKLDSPCHGVRSGVRVLTQTSDADSAGAGAPGDP
ncbi:hypothetical protein EVAR_68824_1 [Eumeta japonica]|uniref:Uncharacterized protein n=1 Tax=Eumeta variegata TaxID=151549 RepID=A0A4C1Z1G1_EUMVA|nr:hypothetical protein EVAR_68824_1 [Eumeta japonica]